MRQYLIDDAMLERRNDDDNYFEKSGLHGLNIRQLLELLCLMIMFKFSDEIAMLQQLLEQHLE